MDKRKKKKLYGLLFLFIIVSVILSVLYISRKNYWPFDNGKISGLPDQHIRSVIDNQTRVDSLVFSQSGAYEMNFSGKEVHFYLEHYQFDQKVETIELGSISRLDEDDYTGHLVWGISDLRTTDAETQKSFGNLMAHLQVSGSSISIEHLLDSIPEFDEGIATSFFITDEPVKIALDEPIAILAWSSNLTGYMDFEDSMSPEAAADRESYVIMYLIFKD